MNDNPEQSTAQSGAYPVPIDAGEGALDALKAFGSEKRGVGYSIKEWFKRKKFEVAIGATILSLGFGIAEHPSGKVLKAVEQKAEWVVPTEFALDVSIGAGFMMMFSATGVMIKNPMEAKKRFKELPARANNSTLFKSGLALSTVSALAWGGVAIGTIVTTIPEEAWGALAFPVVDLASTIGSRTLLWNAVRTSNTPTATNVET